MQFMQFLKSLDDLLYEMITWLVFFPVTFWRTLRHPLRMMAYADAELAQSEDTQYSDTVSPPLFLLLTLLLSHAAELAVVGQSSIVADKQGLAGLISDDASLLLMRLLVFSTFPLIMALRLVRKKGETLTRDTLRLPFYAQCYPTGPFALVLGLGALATQLHWDWARIAGLAAMVVALLWYGRLQVYWFAQQLGVSMLRGFWVATVGMVQCLVVIALVAPLIA
ncbi:MAG: hypothetical protein ABW023_15985 [Sphingomonas sp.]